MSILVSDIDILQQYARGVATRAHHHAVSVEGSVLAILGGIIWRHDQGTLRVRSYAGRPANMLWVKFSGRPYTFRYEHSTGQIEILDGNTHAVLHAIDDTSHNHVTIQALMAAM